MAGLDEQLRIQRARLAAVTRDLSRELVRESLYNRFDRDIAAWTDHYNAERAPAGPLPANVVKALLFEESRLGTSGLSAAPPYDWDSPAQHPLLSRHNLGRCVQPVLQLLMVNELAPDLYAQYGLAELAAEQAARKLRPVETVAWHDGSLAHAVRALHTRRDREDRNLMGTAGYDLYDDDVFWIRATVRWLFALYEVQPRVQRTWAAAVQAYGGNDEAYRRSVMSRARGDGDLQVSH
jgi:hypothetical protein